MATATDNKVFKLVPLERAIGEIAGYNFGSHTRLLLRSPSHVLFVARGVHIWRRSPQPHHQDVTRLVSTRVTRATLQTQSPKIDEVFGPGSGATAVLAWGMNQTALVDGGGAPMPLCRRARQEQFKAERAASTADWREDLSGELPRCRQCAAPLTPFTTSHHMNPQVSPTSPRTPQDCRKLSNARVIAVHSFDDPRRWSYVSRFETWDGETLHDLYFCDDRCASVYGRRAAELRPTLPQDAQIETRPHRVPESIRHYRETPSILDLGDGRTVTI